jgi:hypothetical protein
LKRYFQNFKKSRTEVWHRRRVWLNLWCIKH